jgi:hypothetical protein
MSVAAANLASSSSSSVVLNVSISTFSLNNGTDLPYGTFVGTIISNSGGICLPHNLKDKVFTHFPANNIDINDSTLDGKNNVHATQMAAWQR